MEVKRDPRRSLTATNVLLLLVPGSSKYGMWMPFSFLPGRTCALVVDVGVGNDRLLVLLVSVLMVLLL